MYFGIVKLSNKHGFYPNDLAIIGYKAKSEETFIHHYTSINKGVMFISTVSKKFALFCFNRFDGLWCGNIAEFYKNAKPDEMDILCIIPARSSKG